LSTNAFLSSIYHEKLDRLEILITNGTDPNIQNTDGETALTLAIKKKNYNIVKLLHLYGSGS